MTAMWVLRDARGRLALSIPTPAVLLALDLERRGIVLRMDGDQLIARPKESLTPDDIAALQQWRADVIRVLRYEPPPLESR
jgi:TubC N-terminal docking domain